MRNCFFTALALIFFSSAVFSAEKLVEVEKPVSNRFLTEWGIYGNFSYLDLLLPSKLGFSVYKSFIDKNTEYEFQYLKGNFGVPIVSVDLFQINDRRITFLKRNFSDSGNFNWYYGFSYLTFDGQLGNDYIRRLTSNGQQTKDVALFDIETLGADFGIGHRWQLRNNFTFGLDWICISQPLIVLRKDAPFLDAETTSQSDRDNARRLINAAAYFPRIALLKLQLGYAF